jgi:hypothetical protein
MATETTQQIVREAPEIEALKIQLMEQAQKLALSDTLSKELARPEAQYRIAGFDPTQEQALKAAERQGIGAFAPYLQTASQALSGGYGLTGEAADILRGADVRNQFTDAQRAMQQAGGATAQMTAGLPLLGQAQQLAGAAAGAPGFAQGIGAGYTAAEQARMAAAQPGFRQGIEALYAAAQQAQDASRLGAAPTIGAVPSVGTQSFTAPGAASQYMSPYMQGVVDIQLREAQRQDDIAKQARAAQAVRSGAFGGTREGVVEAEAGRNLARLQADLQAQGLQQSFQQGQQQFNVEQQTGLAAQQANQQAMMQAALANQQLMGQYGLSGAQLGLQGSEMLRQAGMGEIGAAAQLAGLGQQAAQQLGQAAALQTGTTAQQAGLQQQAANIYGQLAGQTANIYGQQAQQLQGLGQGIGALAGQQFGIGQQIAGGLGALGQQMGGLGIQAGALGQTAQGMSQADINFLYNIGQSRQAQQQQVYDAQRASAMQQMYVPYQQAAFLSDIYRGAPSSQMATTAASTPQPSPFQQVAGTALGALATGAAIKKLF